MNLKELKELYTGGKVHLGIKEVLKSSKKKGKKLKVFVAKDSRDETIKKLGDAGINFEFLKTKKEISDELDLDFESEIYSID
jgi:ribosomal protein L7Ae-like RNA K-turn-binding protein